MLFPDWKDPFDMFQLGTRGRGIWTRITFSKQYLVSKYSPFFFPFLSSVQSSPAIANVNYSIYMNQLKPFQIEKEDLIDFLNASNS